VIRLRPGDSGKRPESGILNSKLVGGPVWSGARDLNPGPHGPEPAQWYVLLYPGGSFRVLLNMIRRSVVSSRVLLYPPGSASL